MRKFLLIIPLLAFLSCEKPAIEDAEGKYNVLLHFNASVSDVTRAVVPVGDYCSRINVALFKGDDKVKTLSQKSDDANFGSCGLSVAEGTYTLVVVAHSCSGSATVSGVEKCTFPSNKVTDTFCYCGKLVVDGETKSQDIQLDRVTAKLQVVLDGDDIPENVSQLRFYYLGGSSTLSPEDGLGCVNSKQTEVRDVNNTGEYELFTFPHQREDILTKMVVTALDENGDDIKELTINDISVKQNFITRFTVSLFGSGGSKQTDGGVNFVIDPEWEGINEYHF